MGFKKNMQITVCPNWSLSLKIAGHLTYFKDHSEQASLLILKNVTITLNFKITYKYSKVTVGFIGRNADVQVSHLIIVHFNWKFYFNSIKFLNN